MSTLNLNLTKTIEDFFLPTEDALCVVVVVKKPKKIHLQARCIILKMTFHTVHSTGSTKTSLRPHTSSEVCFLAAYMESLFLHTLKYWL